jgi:hypothetical protein
MCGQKGDGGTDKKKGQAWRDGVSGRSSPIEELGMESVPYPINNRASTQIVTGRNWGRNDVKRSGGTNGKEGWGRKLGEDENVCPPVNPRGVATQRKSIRANKRTVNPGPKNRKTKKKRASTLITIAWRR